MRRYPALVRRSSPPSGARRCDPRGHIGEDRLPVVVDPGSPSNPSPMRVLHLGHRPPASAGPVGPLTAQLRRRATRGCGGWSGATVPRGAALIRVPTVVRMRRLVRMPTVGVRMRRSAGGSVGSPAKREPTTRGRGEGMGSCRQGGLITGFARGRARRRAAVRPMAPSSSWPTCSTRMARTARMLARVRALVWPPRTGDAFGRL